MTSKDRVTKKGQGPADDLKQTRREASARSLIQPNTGSIAAKLGGRRSAGGIDFQAQLTAMFSVYALCRDFLQLPFGLPPNATIERISCETGEDVDDIRLDLRSSAGQHEVFIQAKRNIKLDATKDGELAKTMTQFAQQMRRSAVIPRTLLLVASDGSRARMHALERARRLLIAGGSEKRQALNKLEIRAVNALRELLISSEINSDIDSSRQQESILDSISFVSIDLEEHGPHSLRAIDALQRHVLGQSRNSGAAWLALVSLATTAIKKGEVHTPETLKMELIRAGVLAMQFSADISEDGITSARRLCRQMYASNLSSFIDPSTESPLALINRVVAKLEAGQSLELVAPSGMGKTHLVRHVAVALADNGYFPVVLDCRFVKPNPEDWIEDFAAMRGLSASDIAQLTRQKNLIIIVDGVNELDKRVRDRFEQIFILWKERYGGILCTSQISLNFSECETIGNLTTYDIIAKQKLLGLDTAPAAGIVPSALVAFSRPFELCIARQNIQTLPPESSPYDVVNSFITAMLESATDPISTRRRLACFAMRMVESVRVSAPLDTALIFQRDWTTADTRETYATGLLLQRSNRVAFTHELIRNHFAALQVLISADSSRALAEQCNKPALAEIADLVFQGIDDDVVRRHALTASSSLRGSATSAAHGTMGIRLRDWIRVECERVVELAIRALRSLRVGIDNGDGTATEFDTATGPIRTLSPNVHLAINTERKWDKWESTCLSIVGTLVHTDEYWPLAERLINASDLALGKKFLEVRIDPKQGFARAYDSLGFAPMFPAAMVITAVSYSQSPVDPQGSCFRVLERRDLSVGLRALLMRLISQVLTKLYMSNAAETPFWLQTVPKFIEEIWSIGAPHLQHDTLNLIRPLIIIDAHEEVAQLKHWAESLQQSENWGVNATIIDILDELGLTSFHGDPSVMIRHALSLPRSEDKFELAQALVANQLEPVIGDAHCNAVRKLEAADLVTLLSMAALGSEQSEYISAFPLGDLVSCDPTALRSEPLALQAFQYWSHTPEPTNWLPSEVVEGFLLAGIGLKQFNALVLPDTFEPWHLWRYLLLTDSSNDDSSIWSLLRSDVKQSSAPLEWIICSPSSRKVLRESINGLLARREELVRYLQLALPLVDDWIGWSLSLIHPPGETLIALAGELGISELETTLRGLVSHSRLGSAAVQSLKALSTEL